MNKNPTKKRVIPEERIFRTLVVCYDKNAIDQAKRAYTLDLHQRKIKYEDANNIVSYTLNRTMLVKAMFLTPDEERRVIGRRYNEVQPYDRVSQHPRFEQFITAIEPYRILNLFLASDEAND